MAIYESEITLFIRELKEKKPYLEAEQKKGRALLWDKTPIEPDEAERSRTSSLAQQAYVYANK